jgi:glycolate oxidase FAD binding subunit
VVTIDDVGPMPVVRPESVAAVGELVRQAAAEGHGLYPLGGQTMLDFGLPPSRKGIGIDLRALNQVIDYPARDMTITVQAGITLARLQEILAAENQRLPIDVPHAERATLGGALATNVNGPRRYGFGTFRDYVIGMSVVNDQGEEVKAGGRVVKNVAGYDLPKLFIGVLGTLGIITQVTLKLKPQPEKRTLAELHCPEDALARVLDTIHSSPTRPVSVTVRNPPAAERALDKALRWVPDQPAAPPGDWLILVGFEDNCMAVDWQVEQLHSTVASLGIGYWRHWSHATGATLWRDLADFSLLPDSRLTFKANLLPRQVAAFCQQADALPEVDYLQAEAGNGIVIGHAQEDLTLDSARTMLKTLQEAAAAAQGNVILLRCPTDWKAALPVWGQPRGDAWLMRAIKDGLDPRRLFNPGRFVDGL